MNDAYNVLRDIDKKHSGHNILGKGLLTLANVTSSSRLLMVASQIEQNVNLEYPEIPRFFTGYENMFGKYSEDACYKTDKDYKVIAKIQKYPDIEDHIYTLILESVYDNSVHIVEKKQVENLSEYYGFRYNTEKMDEVKVDQVVPEGETLYKSTSFDDDMNFRYGTNAKSMYLCLTKNTEDAIVICESLKKNLESTEVETVKVSVNTNDTLTYYYGDKTFPDIGEYVKDKVIANVRRIDYSQVAYSLSRDNLKEILNSDQPHYTSNKKSRIIDINVYSNQGKWEFQNNQIAHYYDNQCRYQQEIMDILEEKINEGKALSDEAMHTYNYCKDSLNEDKKWISDGREFNNIVIEFLVSCKSEIEIGSKIVGRYGDKGVISDILPDDQMPITEDGLRAEMISTGDGVIGRLNTGQLFEMECNFVIDRLIARLKKEKATPKMCRKELIDFFTLCNSKYGEFLDDLTSRMDDKGVEKFVESIMNKPVINVSPGFDEDAMSIERLRKIYNRFPTPKYKMYTKLRGRRVKMQKEYVMGDKYIMRLKHTPKSKFSARSVYKINSKMQPCKSKDAKQNKVLHSKTPVRFGEMELAIIASAMPHHVKQLLNLHTNVGATEFLYTTNLNTEYISPVKNAKNRSLDILKIYLNTMGIDLGVSDAPAEPLFINEIDPDVDYRVVDVAKNHRGIVEEISTTVEKVNTKVIKYQ